MAKNDPKNAQDQAFEVEAVDVPAVPEPAVAEVFARRISFEQWAARRAIPTQNRRGLKAFAGGAAEPKSLEDWDKLFSTY